MKMNLKSTTPILTLAMSLATSPLFAAQSNHDNEELTYHTAAGNMLQDSNEQFGPWETESDDDEWFNPPLNPSIKNNAHKQETPETRDLTAAEKKQAAQQARHLEVIKALKFAKETEEAKRLAAQAAQEKAASQRAEARKAAEIKEEDNRSARYSAAQTALKAERKAAADREQTAEEEKKQANLRIIKARQVATARARAAAAANRK